MALVLPPVLVPVGSGLQGAPFDPLGDEGPVASNALHLNNVYCDAAGMYLSGLKTGALVRFDGRTLKRVATLPRGVHNARPWKEGVLFNDTGSDAVRYVGLDGTEQAFAIHTYDESMINHAGVDDSKIARQGFGRGLCPIDERFIAAGSSPSTITLYDTVLGEKVGFVNLSLDIRNAIHGLEVWPWDD